MADITLSAGVRQNLLSLQNTADLMAKTQNRLATGKKVNSALDNPTNFFTSSALQSRAGDMAALLDNMSNGIKTLEAADNGLSSITKTIESMQSTLRQARQDKSFASDTFEYTLPATLTGTENITFTGGAFGEGISQSVSLTAATSTVTAGAYTDVDFTNAGANDSQISFTVSANGGAAQTVTITHAEAAAVAADASAVTVEEMAQLINNELTTLDIPVTAAVTGGVLTFTGASADGAVADVTIGAFAATNGATGSGIANGSGTDTVTAKTVDQLVSEINRRWLDSPANSVPNPLYGNVRASNDSGKLRIENISTQELDVTGTLGATEIGGNQVRANLVKQFNELRDQLDKLADDASYNGINLLRGDLLKLTFNETGTSTIEIQARDLEGQERPINTSTLGLTLASEPDFDSDASIDQRLDALTNALGVIRSQSSSFGSNLSIVENRTAFTKAMMNTLQTGADSLVLADTNEEAANMLALQTRQQLSSTALSLASQADQAVLRLFG